MTCHDLFYHNDYYILATTLIRSNLEKIILTFCVCVCASTQIRFKESNLFKSTSRYKNIGKREIAGKKLSDEAQIHFFKLSHTHYSDHKISYYFKARWTDLFIFTNFL